MLWRLYIFEKSILNSLYSERRHLISADHTERAPTTRFATGTFAANSAFVARFAWADSAFSAVGIARTYGKRHPHDDDDYRD